MEQVNPRTFLGLPSQFLGPPPLHCTVHSTVLHHTVPCTVHYRHWLRSPQEVSLASGAERGQALGTKEVLVIIRFSCFQLGFPRILLFYQDFLGFPLGFYQDFDLILISVRFGLVWAGFGLILVGFGLDLIWISVHSTFHSSHSSPRRSQAAPSGIRRSSLGKATKVTEATRVIKCIIEHEIDHLASQE